MVKNEKIEDEFLELIENCDSDIFWSYVKTWLDESDLIDKMSDWSIDTKKEAIKEIKELQNRRQKNGKK